MGRVHTWLAAAVGVIGTAGPVSADYVAGTHALDIGVQLTSFNYEEPGLMEISGLLPGIRGGYEYRRGPLMLQLAASYAGADMDYDGHLQSGDVMTPHRTDTSDTLLSLEARVGEVRELESGELQVFVGLGYRYWDNTLHGIGGYRRETTYVYLPLGIGFDHRAAGLWRFGWSGEYRLLARGLNRSHLSDIGLVDMEFKQRDGWGARASLRFVRSFGGRNLRELRIEPYVEYWDVGDSEGVALFSPQWGGYAVFYEPANTTLTYGASFSIGF